MAAVRIDALNDDAAQAGAYEALTRLLDDDHAERLTEGLRRWKTAPPRGRFVIGRGMAPRQSEGAASVAVFSVWDSGDPPGSAWPHLARLLRADSGWTLVSLLAQCTSCFGYGLVEPGSRPCDTCLARGWGLRESEDFPIQAEAPAR